MKSIFAAFARNTVFANILLIIIFAAGTFSVINMVRETFPEFELDIINVRVLWPGADPEDVEEGICRKIEEAISGIEGIKQYNAIASENVGTVMVEVREGYDARRVLERVRNAVDGISTFPLDAERPITEELTLRQEVLMIALYGEDLDERLLKEWAEEIKEEIRLLDSVSQVRVMGAREYEIGIELSEERLREYNLTFSQVADLIRASNLNLAGGTVRTQGEDIRLRTVGRKYTGAELAEIVVLAGPRGEKITLDRIAVIRDDFVEDPVFSHYNGMPAISVAVLKTREEDSIAIANEVKAYVERKQPSLPEGVYMSIWSDSTDILEARINLLLRNGLMGLTLIFCLLWIFLDIRLSFWAGMGMPICIAGALALMWMLGATLNMISLFALIMVLGIIVDDAIVVGEAIYVHRKRGESPLKAAVEGVYEVGMPVLAAVTTTIVAFTPLFFVGGIMGKFIAILPVVVVACLILSLVECLVLLPAHLSHLPDPNEKVVGRHPIKRFGQRFHGLTSNGLEWFIHHVYEPFLGDAVLRFRYVSVAIAVAVMMLTLGLMQSGILKFEVFPRIDGDQITATVEFPDGTPIAVTEEAVYRIEDAFKRLDEQIATPTGEPLLRNMFGLVGSTIDDFMPRRGQHLGSVRVEMLDNDRRNIHTNDIMAAWEEAIGPLPGAVALSFVGLEAGPPGAAIEVWLQGHDLDALLGAAEDLKDKLGAYDGVYQIQHDFRPGKNELRFELRPEARTLGITLADLAFQVNAGYFGEEALRIQRGRDDVRIRVRYTTEERRNIADIEHMRVRTRDGQEVPLHSVAKVTHAPGVSTINRTNGLRRVAVTAEVNPARANANEIVDELIGVYFEGLRERYPGLIISLEGEKKNAEEAFGGLRYSYPLALLGMFVIIATIFRSYIQPFIILVTVPFGIIGSVLGHLLLGFDLSMMSFFGMVALSGVVVNNAIVLIERFNENMARGLALRDAVRQAGARRFRAIFLTTLTTVGGLSPLIMETDMQAMFMIPMAISIAGGVAFSTLLTLLLIPCLLVILNDLRRIARWLRTREWPTPEEVEPARWRYTELAELEDDAPPAVVHGQGQEAGA